jgi:UDP-N-acetylmuramoyl-tripeptide--D-alanyl-D-alanine ligase
MKAALENFNQLKGSPKIVFLGDMFELGKDTETEHQKIAELATLYNFSEVYLIGKAFSTTRVKNAFNYDSFDNFKNSNSSIKINNATILIKGSRGMALERILNLFKF